MTATISAIDPMPSDPNVLRVRVEGRIEARLSRPDVEALKLAVGQKWTSTRAEAVHRAVETAKARKSAFATLGRRALSRRALIERLIAKGHAEPIAKSVADQLENDGWIDDVAYARSIVHEVVRKRPASAAFLQERLQAKKVDDSAIESVLAEHAAVTDPLEQAFVMAQEKLCSMKKITSNAAAAVRRIASALERRGFDVETVEVVIQRLGLLPEDD